MSVLSLDQLLPCPFCDGGESYIEDKHLSPTMKGPGALISVVIRHWCPKAPGVVHTMREVRGRDHASALAGWNQRRSDG